MEILGVLGGFFLLSAWLFETEEAIRKHKKLIDLKFAFIYITGNMFMTLYSITTGNRVFIFINAAILILVAFEILYTLHFKVFDSWHKELRNVILGYEACTAPRARRQLKKGLRKRGA